MEKPDNQIKVLETKISDLSQLLIEWKNYEQIINMSMMEMKQLQDSMYDQLAVEESTLEDVINSSEQQGARRQESSDGEFDKHQNSEIIQNENESEDSAIESLFSSEMFKSLEMEYERLKDKGVDLYGEEESLSKDEQSEVKFSEKFINSVLPEINGIGEAAENLESLEELVTDQLRVEDLSENKIITDLLLIKLNSLENEQLSTRQKNKIRKMKTIVERLANVKIFNPNLLEKLVRIVN